MSRSTALLISAHWLRPLRVMWVICFAVTITALAASVPVMFTQAHEVCRQTWCSGPQLHPGQIRSLHHAGLSLTFYGAYVAGMNAVFGLVYCAVGALIFVRRSQERMALLSASFLVVFGGLTFPGVPEVLGAAFPILQIPAGLTVMLGALLLILFFLLFPSGRLVPGWSIWLAPVLPLVQGPGALFPNSAYTLDRLPFLIGIVPFFGILLFVLAAQVYRFRRVSTTIERQQTKWVVLGIGTALGGFLVFVVASVVLPPALVNGVFGTLVAQSVMYAFMLLIPLSIALALFRYNLWEADVLINRTLVYGSLTISLGGGYLLGVIAIQAVFRGATGQSSDLAVAIATLVVAGLFNPWRRRVQTFIDRRFYRQRYDAGRALASFTSRLRDEVDLEHVSEGMAAVIVQTVRPSTLSIWLSEEQRT